MNNRVGGGGGHYSPPHIMRSFDPILPGGGG